MHVYRSSWNPAQNLCVVSHVDESDTNKLLFTSFYVFPICLNTEMLLCTSFSTIRMNSMRKNWYLLVFQFFNDFSPTRLAYEGVLTGSQTISVACCGVKSTRLPWGMRPPGFLGPGLFEGSSPPASLGLQSLVPRPKVRSQKCQKCKKMLSRCLNQWINESMNQWLNESKNQSSNE